MTDVVGILVHPAVCLLLGLGAFSYWCRAISRCNNVSLRAMPLKGIPFLIRKHRLATVRFPLDVVAVYVLSVIFIAVYGFGFQFSELEKIPNLKSNMTAAIGAGVVEAFIAICTQLAGLTELNKSKQS